MQSLWSVLRMRRPRGLSMGLVHAVVVVALLSWPLPVHASGHLRAFAHRDSCAFVERASARSVPANSSQQKIKNEATGRRVLCMLSERAWQQLPRASLAQFQLLTVKPSYPPSGARGEKVRASVATSASSNRTLLHTAARASGVWTPDAQVLPCECTCDDVHELRQRLQILEGEQRALSRSLYRLESFLGEALQAIRNADDVAFLERQTSAIVVYNENLTSKRELRLLREELKKVSDKYGI